MKAAPADQGRLLDLQELDSRIDQLAHRRRTLPDQVEVDRLTAQIQVLRDEFTVADTECSDLDRDQRKAEADVEQVRTRARRDRERMDAGRVGSAKELQGLQHELDSLARRQNELEEIELEVMERVEAAQSRRAEVAAAQAILDADLTEVGGRRDVTFAEIDAESAKLRDERMAVSATVPADLLALYERLRKSSGVGAAALRHRRCGGCRLELNANEMGTIRAAPEDDVLRCEECGRILVRVADSGL